MGIPSYTLDEEMRAVIREIQPAGFILFGRNIREAGELRALIDELRSLVRLEPIITIDQEGGRVSRLKLIGEEPPSIVQLRQRGELGLFREHGRLTGQLLRLFGFNLNLCPVLDVSFDDEADNSLRGRTFGRTADEVIERATAFTEAMRGEGILACGKHFPSYAAAGVDPHHELPEVNRSYEELSGNEWRPFHEMAPMLDAMMVGHLRNRHLDPAGTPSTLSSAMVRGVLRHAWHYEGAIMTDDMDMGAILNDYGFEESVSRAFEAGNDLILLCHRVTMVQEAARVLAGADEVLRTAAAQRIAGLRARFAQPRRFSMEEFRRVNEGIYALRVATLGAEQAAVRSPEDGKRSPVELY